jgi:hypothetical protein
MDLDMSVFIYTKLDAITLDDNLMYLTHLSLSCADQDLQVKEQIPAKINSERV